tara:strand:- start:6055 stop:6228 length:174 start_codon:yes stop_codon:yes gene_type:complete
MALKFITPKKRIAVDHLYDMVDNDKLIGDIWTNTIFIDSPHSFDREDMVSMIKLMKL